MCCGVWGRGPSALRGQPFPSGSPACGHEEQSALANPFPNAPTVCILRNYDEQSFKVPVLRCPKCHRLAACFVNSRQREVREIDVSGHMVSQRPSEAHREGPGLSGGEAVLLRVFHAPERSVRPEPWMGSEVKGGLGPRQDCGRPISHWWPGAAMGLMCASEG